MAHLQQSKNTVFDESSEPTPHIGYEPARHVNQPDGIDSAISQHEFPDFNDVRTRIAALAHISKLSGNDYGKRPFLSWTAAIETCWAMKSAQIGSDQVLLGYEPAPKSQDRKAEFCRLDLIAMLLDKELREGMLLNLANDNAFNACLLYTSPSPRDVEESRMASSA